MQQHLGVLSKKQPLPASERQAKALAFKIPGKLNQCEIVDLVISSKFDQFTRLFKQEMQQLCVNLQKKRDTLKNEGCKLLINGQISKSGMPFEVKSNNVMVFREQLLADFLEFSHLLDRYHSACLSAKNFFLISQQTSQQNFKPQAHQPQDSLQLP